MSCIHKIPKYPDMESEFEFGRLFSETLKDITISYTITNRENGSYISSFKFITYMLLIQFQLATSISVSYTLITGCVLLKIESEYY